MENVATITVSAVQGHQVTVIREQIVTENGLQKIKQYVLGTVEPGGTGQFNHPYDSRLILDRVKQSPVSV